MRRSAPCSGAICIIAMSPSAAVSAIRSRSILSGGVPWATRYSWISGDRWNDFGSGMWRTLDLKARVTLRVVQHRGGVRVRVVVAEESAPHLVVGLHGAGRAEVVGCRQCRVVDVVRVVD